MRLDLHIVKPYLPPSSFATSTPPPPPPNIHYCVYNIDTEFTNVFVLFLAIVGLNRYKLQNKGENE